ncbi:unnamed protein product [Tuber melanosporum]|uniref:EKC/KEOPS complex subunit CGI121 n=1 Tax=Tuber melanosporum (strain Mel28) TaxID=656061 RepID=D5GGV4_TUBMM|nr:uncharacterized protein GSTUM_00002050001 [Tuber melanosporum]CAZ83747.1 unnamed protein product [Tuber melanosporum]
MTTTYTLPHLPPHKIHITHLPSLQPAAFKTFQQELTSSTATPSGEYAFLDASVILSTTHLLAAVFQAVRNELVSGKRRTRNVHSEVVYCLGGNNNIKEAYKKVWRHGGDEGCYCCQDCAWEGGVLERGGGSGGEYSESDWRGGCYGGL